eukprot:g1810.t1
MKHEVDETTTNDRTGDDAAGSIHGQCRCLGGQLQRQGMKHVWSVVANFEKVNKELTVSDQIGEALKKNDLIFAERMMSSLKGGDEQLNGGDMENLIKLAGLSTEQTADFYKGTRSAFLTPSDEAACWNNLLKKIRREKPDASETMNEILHVLNIMDRELGVQPDLAVMEQLFQYFPR